MRAGDVICYSLNTESYAKEASRLQGFFDYDAMEVSVKEWRPWTSLISQLF
jgi:hypothetical protein